MFVVQASRLPKAAETAAPQLLSNLVFVRKPSRAFCQSD